MLSRIAIENYRSCLSTSFNCDPHLTVLIGPNSSGKTNILQAIMFLNKMTQGDEYDRLYAESVNVTSSLSVSFALPKFHARLRATIDAYTDESNSDVLVSARQRWLMKDTKGAISRFEKPLFIGGMPKKRWVLSRRMYMRMSRRRRVNTFPPEGIPSWANDAFTSIARYCSGMRYYSASQFTNPGACPVSFEIEKEGERSRPWRLRGHAKTLYNIYLACKDEASDRFSRFMDIVGPDGLCLVDKILFREMKTSSIEVTVRVGGKIERQRRQKVLVIPQFKRGRQVLSPNQLSEGTFKTLALLFNIITDDSTALLIEEPEVCVHHGLLASILELIKKYSHSKQMFVSTHSDFVLDHVSPENVFTVRFDRMTGTEAHHIRKTMTSREYSALRHYLQNEGNLGDYWREGGLEGNSK